MSGPDTTLDGQGQSNGHSEQHPEPPPQRNFDLNPPRPVGGIRPEFEGLVPLSAARLRLPEGRSYTRMLEYVRFGVAVRNENGQEVARIKLKAIRTPSGWATSRLAWSEFLQEITDAHLAVSPSYDHG